ncbi:MAG: hypothetical protein ACJ73S_10785 [Mycobacteriales bacterium]
MPTLEQLIARHGTDVLEHLDRQIDIPVTDRPQIQGDVSVLPVSTAAAARTLVPPDGVAVVRGAGGNTHSLHGDGRIWYDPAPGDGRDGRGNPASLALGTLTVPAGSTAWLAHPEHGYLGIAPGTYRIGRQREHDPRVRNARVVAD